jgi:hypothetical protein
LDVACIWANAVIQNFNNTFSSTNILKYVPDFLSGVWNSGRNGQKEQGLQKVMQMELCNARSYASKYGNIWQVLIERYSCLSLV